MASLKRPRLAESGPAGLEQRIQESCRLLSWAIAASSKPPPGIRERSTSNTLRIRGKCRRGRITRVQRLKQSAPVDSGPEILVSRGLGDGH